MVSTSALTWSKPGIITGLITDNIPQGGYVFLSLGKLINYKIPQQWKNSIANTVKIF
jgi:hypothetical protein